MNWLRRLWRWLSGYGEDCRLIRTTYPSEPKLRGGSPVRVLQSVAHNGETWVAVGGDSINPSYIITSPDGVVWTERCAPR